MIKCKKCNSEGLHFYELVIQWWTVNNIDEDGFVDMGHAFATEDTEDEGRLQCDKCHGNWSIEEHVALPPYKEPKE